VVSLWCPSWLLSFGEMADKDAAFAKALRAALANDKAKALASTTQKPAVGTGGSTKKHSKGTAATEGDPRPPRLGLGALAHVFMYALWSARSWHSFK
jgi:hypothetical protein